MLVMYYAMTLLFFDAAHCWRRFNRINLFDKSFIEFVTRCSIMWCVKAINRLLHIPFDTKLLFFGCPFNCWLSAYTHTHSYIYVSNIKWYSQWMIESIAQSWQLYQQMISTGSFHELEKSTHRNVQMTRFEKEIYNNIINKKITTRLTASHANKIEWTKNERFFF